MDVIVKNHEQIREMLNQTTETVETQMSLISEPMNLVRVKIKLNKK